MKPWVWLLAGIVASVVNWTYIHRILLPWEQYVHVQRGNVKVPMGDLYPRWVGTQEMLLHGLNPYSAQVSHKIQTAFYGHPIEQTYEKPESEIVDEQRFAYPVYVVFLLAPMVHTDFDVLQRWAPLVLGALTVVSIWLWQAVLHWRPPLWSQFVLVLLVLSSPQLAQGLRLRQFGLLAAFLVALATWCVLKDRLVLAGIFLAVATIKPQMVALCLVWFFIWSIGDWKKRRTLVAGFTVTLGTLIGTGDLLVPGWVRYFLEGLEAYRKYFPVGTLSIARLILGNWVGGILSVVAAIVLLIYAWNRRTVSAESADFAWTLSLFFITTTLVLPLMPPYNQVLLLLPLLIFVRDWIHLPRWDRMGFAVFMAWPFVAAAGLLIFPPPIDMRRSALLPSTLLLFVPLLFLWLMFTLSRRESMAQ